MRPLFLPVTVDAMTTRTAATTIATIQRTQSTPALPLPPNARVDEPAEDDAADAAQDGQPDRDVVLVARSDELAQQPDDDARDDDADDLHEVSLPVNVAAVAANASPYPQERVSIWT